MPGYITLPQSANILNIGQTAQNAPAGALQLRTSRIKDLTYLVVYTVLFEQLVKPTPAVDSCIYLDLFRDTTLKFGHDESVIPQRYTPSPTNRLSLHAFGLITLAKTPSAEQTVNVFGRVWSSESVPGNQPRVLGSVSGGGIVTYGIGIPV